MIIRVSGLTYEEYLKFLSDMRFGPPTVLENCKDFTVEITAVPKVEGLLNNLSKILGTHAGGVVDE